MKPNLKLSMLRSERIPTRAYLARKIGESYRFIDSNRRITLAELPQRHLRFWKVDDYRMLCEMESFPITDDRLCRPGMFRSLAVFTHIYTLYYTGDDYADFQNFWNTFVLFQRMLFAICEAGAEGPRAGKCRVFDLMNLSETIDTIYRGL